MAQRRRNVYELPFARIMPILRNPLNDLYYEQLFKEGFSKETIIDFTEDNNGRLMAQILYKELCNFRQYIFKHILSPFYFSLIKKIERTELKLRGRKVILCRKRLKRFNYFRERRMKIRFLKPVSNERNIL